MAFVYILKSQKNNQFYIGSTIDVNNRFIKHQKGEVKTTKNLRPLTLEFYQYFPTIKEAKIIEYKWLSTRKFIITFSSLIKL